MISRRSVVSYAAVAAGASASRAGSAETPISVKLAVLNDMSGQFADVSGRGSVVAAQMAAEDAGAGLKVEIIAGDHQNKADVGAGLVRHWIDRDNVDVVLDVPVSSVALAISPIIREKNRIFINSGAGAAELTGSQCSANTLQFTYDTYALANGTASALSKVGGETWFFITADYARGVQGTLGLLQPSGDHPGRPGLPAAPGRRLHRRVPVGTAFPATASRPCVTPAATPAR